MNIIQPPFFVRDWGQNEPMSETDNMSVLLTQYAEEFDQRRPDFASILRIAAKQTQHPAWQELALARLGMVRDNLPPESVRIIQDFIADSR